MAHSLLKTHICERCKDKYKSYMTYKKGDRRLCGGQLCFEKGIQLKKKKEKEEKRMRGEID